MWSDTLSVKLSQIPNGIAIIPKGQGSKGRLRMLKTHCIDMTLVMLASQMIKIVKGRQISMKEFIVDDMASVYIKTIVYVSSQRY